MKISDKGWLAVFLISMAIFCISVWSIFARPTTFTEVEFSEGEKSTAIVSESALSLVGLSQLSTTWREYPSYFISCAAIGVLSAAIGMISVMALHSLREEIVK